MSFLTDLTRRFILGEGNINKPSLQSFLESLSKMLESIRPSSTRDGRLLEVAKQHLREVRSGVKRLQEEKSLLEEKLKILEEEKDKRKRKK